MPSSMDTMSEPSLAPSATDQRRTQFAAVIRRRWALILAVSVIAPVVAYLLSSSQPREYTATADLVFQDLDLDQELFGTSIVTPSTDPTRDAATDANLLGLRTVSLAAATSLAPKGITVGRVTSDITIGSDEDSDVVPISATDRDPVVAAEIANAYPQAYIKVQSAQERAALTQAEQLVQHEISAIPLQRRSSASAQALQTRSQQIKILAALQTGNAQVAARAGIPSSPSSPRPVQAGIIGLFLGLLIGCLLAIVVERADRRIKTIAEAEDLYQTPLIGVIPQHPSLASGISSEPLVNEAFRMVRARMRYYNVDREMKTVLVTSAEVGEGKTTVAVNLAAIAAEGSAQRVLLIDADLRRPSISRAVGMDDHPGLSELLTRPDHDLATAISDLLVMPYGKDAGSFDVLLAGATPPNPAELLESQRMFDLLRHVASAYDVVIVDTAPVSVVSDAIPLIPQADGVVIVVRLRKSRRSLGRRLAPQLGALRAHVLGLIANGVATSGVSDYGTAYYRYAADARSGDANGDDPSRPMPVPYRSSVATQSDASRRTTATTLARPPALSNGASAPRARPTPGADATGNGTKRPARRRRRPRFGRWSR